MSVHPLRRREWACGGSTTATHNVAIDTTSGFLYRCGGGSEGLRIYSLANPANPTFLGYARGSGNSNYFHDLCVENGYAYGSMIYNGVLRIFDANASLPWPAAGLSSSQTPSRRRSRTRDRRAARGARAGSTPDSRWSGS